jgi:hypothetical protein
LAASNQLRHRGGGDAGDRSGGDPGLAAPDRRVARPKPINLVIIPVLPRQVSPESWRWDESASTPAAIPACHWQASRDSR